MQILPSLGNRATMRRVAAVSRGRGSPRALPLEGGAVPLLDKPVPGEAVPHESALVAELGRRFSSPQLEAAARSGRSSVLVRRADRLAGITAKVVAQLDGDPERVLADLTTPRMANDVMRLARRMDGLSEAQALESSLALHILQGIAADGADEASEYRHGYLRLMARVAQAAPSRGLAGLGAAACTEPLKKNEDWIKEPCGTFNTQGNRDAKIALVRQAYKAETGRDADNCAVNFYTQMRWCSVETYRGVIRGNESARLRGEGPSAADTRERNNLSEAGAAAANIIQAAFDTVISAIQDNLKRFSGLLCRAFKTLLGSTLGGFLCQLLDKVLSLGSLIFATVVSILKDLASGMVDFVLKLLGGRIMEALTVLAKTLNLMLFKSLVVAAAMSPLGWLADFGTRPVLKKDQKPDGPLSIEGMAERVNERQPLFVINVALAVVGLVSAPANPKLAVGALIIAFSPAIAVLFAQDFKNILKGINAKKWGGVTLEACENGLDAIVSLSTAVVTAVLTIKDFYDKLQKKYAEMMGPTQPAGTIREQWARIAPLLKDRLKALIRALAQFKMGTASQAIMGLLPIVAVVVLALGSDQSAMTLEAIGNETFALTTTALVPVATSLETLRTSWDKLTEPLSDAMSAEGAKSIFERECANCRASGLDCPACSPVGGAASSTPAPNSAASSALPSRKTEAPPARRSPERRPAERTPPITPPPASSSIGAAPVIVAGIGIVAAVMLLRRK
jgi:hypothetical protein